MRGYSGVYYAPIGVRQNGSNTASNGLKLGRYGLLSDCQHDHRALPTQLKRFGLVKSCRSWKIWVDPGAGTSFARTESVPGALAQT